MSTAEQRQRIRRLTDDISTLLKALLQTLSEVTQEDKQPRAAPTYGSLTQSQRWWLLHAQRKGYDHGFVTAPTRALVTLEKLGLIEREPGTSRADTHWRVTDAGLSVQPPRISTKRHRK